MVRIAFIILSGFLIVGCGSSSSTPTSPSTPSTPSGSTAVTIPSGASSRGNTAFQPNPVTIQSGTSITWSNTDGTTHDMVADDGSFNSGRVAAGGTFSMTFSAKGSIPYHCSIHPGMVGTIVVQ